MFIMNVIALTMQYLYTVYGFKKNTIGFETIKFNVLFA